MARLLFEGPLASYRQGCAQGLVSSGIHEIFVTLEYGMKGLEAEKAVAGAAAFETDGEHQE